jgi:glucose-6-phosphate 1-dehydrogenase
MTRYPPPLKNQSAKPIEKAHARLLLDVLRGNQNNFVRSDELIRSWEVFNAAVASN